MLVGLLKFATVWLILDVIIIAVMWYFSTVIKPRCPDWWRRMIADQNPPDCPPHI